MAKRTQEERNSGFYAETAERMGRSDRTAFKERDSLKAFHYAYEKAPGYKKFLEGRGVDPGAVKNIDDFSKLPVLKKNMMPERHQNNPPFGGFLAVPVEKLKRIYVSPGPIYDPEGRKEDYWGLRKCLYNAGFRPGDIVMNTFSYHLTPAGIFLDEACNGIGCVTVPTGVGNTEIQAKTMAGLKINGYIGVPSFLMSLIKKMEELGHDTAKGLSMEIALVAGEILSPSLRKGLNDYGIIVRQAYITAELGGVAYECPQENGMHISDDLYIEICDPVTGEPLPAGSIGEVVVTDFSNECYPLVRYGTGDLSVLDEGECLCGRTSYKLKGIMGRADEVTKIKGMFVHPRQIDEAAAKFSGEIEKIRVVVTRSGVTDMMTVEIQLKHGVAGTDTLKTAIDEKIRESTKLRGNTVFVAEIPEGSKKIEDKRKWD
ncbi:MAG: phenylacetate--CoA ligase family protein [Proteobacteria bacterium]|nr:phenylacetate--CoA ligase family protein [Pseudomonadota bacterium]MBU2260866.1 phenylacetate--CoA ligase family protein [Pseudomonadota bacterium]